MDAELTADSDDTMIVAEAATLPVWEPTGEPRVDSALELLVIAEEVPTHEQAEVYSEIHDRLRQALTADSD
jgi:hypothetical protein